MPSRPTVTALVLALAAAPLAVPGPAHAATSISCHASGDVSFKPGVQAFTQRHEVAYFGERRSCVDHSDLGIKSAALFVGLDDVDLSCLAHDVGHGSGMAIIRWNTGYAELVSEADVTVEETTGNTATVTGIVRRGPFEGRRLTGRFQTGLLGEKGECAHIAKAAKEKEAHDTKDEGRDAWDHHSAADKMYGLDEYGVRGAGFKGDFTVG
ncbi:hypothetical protein ETD86_06810 [Nonomuraea turkmeniaca]|uniref:Uncharacterized protein n=1 Tax=Nonomuraea turkmeniaca TaxID=103838 RepID=A0A5S4FT45_9ACTN|nr:hypothetical protein [Nonomuraea turkmeniaca]TMR23858.1 hypothetical protein ETD86_06810 [Nonomuraea turkmeniaca]